MASLNKVLLIGRIGQDPKLSHTPSGQHVANFSVATDEGYKDKDGKKVERTEWHRVVVWGKTAEFCAKYLGKGRLVYIEGQIKSRKWADKDGQEKTTTEIVVNAFRGRVDALDRAMGADTSTGVQSADTSQPRANHGQSGNGDGPAFPSEASGMDSVPF